jgi:hypothetical protein
VPRAVSCGCLATYETNSRVRDLIPTVRLLRRPSIDREQLGQITNRKGLPGATTKLAILLTRLWRLH